MMTIPTVDVGSLVREAAADEGFSPTRIAAEVGKTEQAARGWIHGTSKLTARDLIVLMAVMPSLERRVLAKVAELRG